MEEERQPKSAGLDLWHFGQLRHGLTWSRGLGYRATKRLPDGLWTDCVLLESVWHRRADAPVGLGRASGSVPWGRGSRRREREPVFPDHSSGVILQPDRLLQACLHPSLSISHSPSRILSIPVFLLLSSLSPLSLPRCSCCQPSSLYLLHPVLQTSFRPAINITPSLSLQSSKFLLLFVKQLGSLGIILSFTSLSQSHSSPPSAPLCALQTVPCSFSFSVSLHLPSFSSHPPLSCGDFTFGSAGSANGMRCSLYSSRIQGAPGLPIRGTLVCGPQ